MGKLLLLIPFFCAALPAQDTDNAVPRNNRALTNAIAGLGKRRPPQPAHPVRAAAPAAKTCSVPLKQMRIDDARQFASRQVDLHATEPMPLATVPSPPCGTAPF